MPMDTQRSEDPRRSQGVSPTLRTGPRHKPHNDSADEIIRFVREYQRHRLPSSQVTGIPRKSVLPSIGGGRLRLSDEITTAIDQCEDFHSQNNEQYDELRDRVEYHESTVLGIPVNSSITDSGFNEKPPDLSDSNSEGSDDVLGALDNDDKSPGGYGDSNSNSTNVDPFRYKQGVTITRTKNGSIFYHQDDDDDVKNLDPKLVFREDKIVSSRSTNKTKVTSSTCRSKVKPRHFDPAHPPPTQRMRPRVLPQLPPIDRHDVINRPSAPSPSLSSPYPHSPPYPEDYEDDPDFDTDDFPSRSINENNDTIDDDDDRHNVAESPDDFIECC